MKSKPATSKGVYLRKIAVSSTMGVGVRVEQSIRCRPKAGGTRRADPITSPGVKELQIPAQAGIVSDSSVARGQRGEQVWRAASAGAQARGRHRWLSKTAGGGAAAESGCLLRLNRTERTWLAATPTRPTSADGEPEGLKNPGNDPR
ncbi:hypothetical protein ACU4GD_01070 [Cupriavidus basilensis]